MLCRDRLLAMRRIQGDDAPRHLASVAVDLHIFGWGTWTPTKKTKPLIRLDSNQRMFIVWHVRR